MTIFQDIKDSLRRLYLDDERPWLVGFSGGKDSTMLASLVFDAILSIPPEQRKKPVSVLCTDTRVEIPAIVGMIEGTLDRMRKCSQQHNLSIDINLLQPTIEESFLGQHHRTRLPAAQPRLPLVHPADESRPGQRLCQTAHRPLGRGYPSPRRAPRRKPDSRPDDGGPGIAQRIAPAL